MAKKGVTNTVEEQKFEFTYVPGLKDRFSLRIKETIIKINADLKKFDFIEEEALCARQHYKDIVAEIHGRGEKCKSTVVKAEALSRAKEDMISKVGFDKYKESILKKETTKKTKVIKASKDVEKKGSKLVTKEDSKIDTELVSKVNEEFVKQDTALQNEDMFEVEATLVPPMKNITDDVMPEILDTLTKESTTHEANFNENLDMNVSIDAFDSEFNDLDNISLGDEPKEEPKKESKKETKKASKTKETTATEEPKKPRGRKAKATEEKDVDEEPTPKGKPVNIYDQDDFFGDVDSINIDLDEI